MAIDVFMKIDGIAGESTDPQYKDWIEVLSLDWDISTNWSATRTVNGLRCSEFGVTKVVDKASTQLIRVTTQNELIKEIRLEFCRSGQEKIKYLEYIFKNCHMTRFTLQTESQSGESLPTENIKFRFASVNITYFQQSRESGGTRGQMETQWNIAKWSEEEGRSS